MLKKRRSCIMEIFSTIIILYIFVQNCVHTISHTQFLYIFATPFYRDLVTNNKFLGSGHIEQMENTIVWMCMKYEEVICKYNSMLCDMRLWPRTIVVHSIVSTLLFWGKVNHNFRGHVLQHSGTLFSPFRSGRLKYPVCSSKSYTLRLVNYQAIKWRN